MFTMKNGTQYRKSETWEIGNYHEYIYDHIFENVEDMVIFKERSDLFKLTIEEIVNESRHVIYHHYWNWNKNEL